MHTSALNFFFGGVEQNWGVGGGGGGGWRGGHLNYENFITGVR